MTPLVLLSGWGVDARLWQPLVNGGLDGLEVTTPDWPGYGTRPALADPGDLAALGEAMASDLPAQAVWVGWSLGGLLGAALLDHLAPPRALVLLGMGSRFCAEDGVTAEALATFRRAFDRDPTATWQHFLRWQLQGEPAPRTAHRRLLGLIGRQPSASCELLAAGLAQLATLDVTTRLATPPCPVHRIVGRQDPLLGTAAREAADRQLSDTGHCPMLSRPDALSACLTHIALAPARPLTEESTP
jgi:pimeloyl-[acyl-carrier protein] methyl ester esterase